MANDNMNVVRTLFGVNPDTELMNQTQQDLANIDRVQVGTAGLDAMQSARFIANRGAAAAGYGLGKAAVNSGLFGEQAVDPRVRAAQATQAILQQMQQEGFDASDPIRVKKELALRLGQAGLMREATQLADQVRMEELTEQEKRAKIAKDAAGTVKDLTDARNSQTPLEKLTATGKFTPASLALYKQTGNVEDLALADDKYEKVETDDGVFMVNKTNPDERVRLGDNKQSTSTDQWMLNKWNFYSRKALDPKTGQLDWSRLTAAELAEAKAIASSTRVFGKEGALAYFGDLAQNLGVEESKALASVLRAEAFDKEFTAITKQWLPKGDSASVAKFQAALKDAGSDGIAPAMVYNLLKDPQAARYVSSAIRYINAILRRESGAAVTESEWQRYAAGFIPLPNDTPEAIAEKERARKLWPQTEVDAFSPAMRNAYKNAASRRTDMVPGSARLNLQNPLVAAGVAAKRQGQEAYRAWWATLSPEEKATFKKELNAEKK
jgi:hypothetical protein